MNDAALPPRGTLQSLQRGLQILDMVVTEGRPVTLAEVTRRFGIDKASAFRFLQTLEQSGLVTKDTGRKSYAAGARLLHWSSLVGADGLVALARPHLRALVDETGESGHFAVLSGDRALLLDYIGSSGTVVVRARVGVFEPLHCTALGKALLAFQPQARQSEVLGRLTLERHTDRTLTDRAELEAELDTVRHAGLAHDDAEYDPVLYCLAAPVLGADGTAVGALGVSLVHPLALRDPARLARIGAQVRHHARALGTALGGDATGLGPTA